MLFAFVLATVAQNPISSIEEFKSGKIYTFDFQWLQQYVNAAIFLPDSVNGEKNDKVWSTYAFEVETSYDDPRQQFTVIECNGKKYLYSISAQKFVAFKDGAAVAMDIPTSDFTLVESTYGDPEFPWCLAFEGDILIAAYPVDSYKPYGYMVLGRYATSEQVFAARVTEVGDFENAAELEAILNEALVVGEQLRLEAMDSLSIVLEEVDLFLIEDAQYTANGGGEVELQAEDPAAGNYISSPQEHNINNASSDGGGMAALVDGDTGTFMHTSWGVALDAPHYIQIDLAEPLQKFSIAYHTRVFDGGNDFPDAIEVLGSNNGVDFTPITVLDKDLPQQPNKSWTSGDIVADQPYKHLRFNVTAENKFFHMSEFVLIATADETADEKYLPYVSYIRELVALWNEGSEMYSRGDDKADDIMDMITELNDLMELIKGLVSDEDDPKTIEFIARVKEVYELQSVGCPTGAGRETFKAAIEAAEAKPTTKARLDLAEALEDYYKIEEVVMPTNGTKYTLTFITYSGRRNFLDYTVNEEEGTYALSMVQDTLTNQGLSYPETAVFTCEDNGDGTYSFVTYDGKYLGLPGSGAASGSQTGISESKVDLYLVKMYPNGKCEADVTWEDLFGLMAYHIGGVFPAPNSSGTTFYTGSLPHFMGSWTSAMAIEEYVPGEDTGIDAVAGETVVKGIYDLSGRRVENPAKGIYIINGKKVLVK